jgi:hypothetical protein
MEKYKYIATTREGFVQQIAVGYVRHGYVFFVNGKVPNGKDPSKTDQKLLERYGIRTTKDSRYRRKQRGEANLQYIRFNRDWVMLATKGKHEWHHLERANIRDVRRVPLVVCGYSITLADGGNILNRKKSPGVQGPERDIKKRVRVQISKASFRELKAEFLTHARSRSEDWYRMRFYHIGFEPYAPVRKQLLELLRLVNKVRGTHGVRKIAPDCIRYHRKPVKPFEVPESGKESSACNDGSLLSKNARELEAERSVVLAV